MNCFILTVNHNNHISRGFFVCFENSVALYFCSTIIEGSDADTESSGASSLGSMHHSSEAGGVAGSNMPQKAALLPTVKELSLEMSSVKESPVPEGIQNFSVRKSLALVNCRNLTLCILKFANYHNCTKRHLIMERI